MLLLLFASRERYQDCTTLRTGHGLKLNSLTSSSSSFFIFYFVLRLFVYLCNFFKRPAKCWGGEGGTSADIVS